MIDFAVTWDKQFIFSLTKSWWSSFKEATYTEVKYLFFRAVESTVLWNFPYFIALGSSFFSQGSRFPMSESTNQWLSIRGFCDSSISWVPCFPALPFRPTLRPPPLHTRNTPFPGTARGPTSYIFISLCLCARIHPSACKADFLLFLPTHSSRATLNATSFVTVLSPMVGIMASFPEFYAILFTAHSPSPFGFSFSGKQILRRS